ncbi:hypothetical protein ILUMI_12043 [Ignelater luminosus]|uniref:Uncharacterized protein n=1 Tax=Ignelater luminosus TaxID=2038154 RepID=A0A8K0CV26_IGNLU|nr:hypothetical protein ILUMI_12043 [Ignelater luminosus]
MGNDQIEIKSNENEEKTFNRKGLAKKIEDTRKRRLEGASYVGYKRTKERKAYYDVARNERTLKDRSPKEKGRSSSAKNATKETAGSEKLVLTMDLQSILQCPKTLVSAMYYKQKLQLHNFTTYELNNSEVSLYVWHEVSSNEFTSCLIDYISNIADSYKEVILISDGKVYRYKSAVFGKGHTMMEADSVHSTLEQYFKPPMNSPMDYVARMRVARPKQPYKIKVLNYDFFFKYDDLPTNLPSLRPGRSHIYRYKEFKVRNIYP